MEDLEQGHRAGGSLHLGELIDKHGAELFSDFLHFHRLNLAEWLAGRVPGFTPRLLLSLIEQFPEGSSTAASMQDDPQMRYWGLLANLMAALHNAVQVNTVVTAGVKKQSDRDKFEFIESPAVKKAKSKKKQPGRSMSAKDLRGLIDSQMDQLPDHLRMSKQKKKSKGD